jgi:hypothetical protein
MTQQHPTAEGRAEIFEFQLAATMEAIDKSVAKVNSTIAAGISEVEAADILHNVVIESYLEDNNDDPRDALIDLAEIIALVVCDMARKLR